MCPSSSTMNLVGKTRMRAPRGDFERRMRASCKLQMLLWKQVPTFLFPASAGQKNETNVFITDLFRP